MGAWLPERSLSRYTHLNVSICELTPLLPPRRFLKSGETRATCDCLGGLKRFVRVFEEPEPTAGLETSSGDVWDRQVSCL